MVSVTPRCYPATNGIYATHSALPNPLDSEL
ncbi:hypothetical protein HNQ71_001895 [Mesorhizobium sangaii]|uniref:Uncharacterized protein n=1 Tax=Mesorhizobium sangaii TaxID=505389 RepID=A0A841PEI2_9HYPH|nr:hypothetical protein [Mesorhizobium sangaii]